MTESMSRQTESAWRSFIQSLKKHGMGHWAISSLRGTTARPKAVAHRTRTKSHGILPEDAMARQFQLCIFCVHVGRQEDTTSIFDSGHRKQDFSLLPHHELMHVNTVCSHRRMD